MGGGARSGYLCFYDCGEGGVGEGSKWRRRARVTCDRGMVSRFRRPHGMKRVRGTDNMNAIKGTGYNSVVEVFLSVSSRARVVGSYGFGAFKYNTTITADDVTARVMVKGAVRRTVRIAGGTIVRTLSKLPPMGMRYSLLTRRTVRTTL